MGHKNPNLVPTRVTDKSGRTTTVYRRAASSTPEMTTIPPVAAPQGTAVKKRMSSAGMELLDASPTLVGRRLYLLLKHDRNRLSKKTKEEMISGLHEDTLKVLDRTALNEQVEVLGNLFSLCIREKSFASLNNTAVVAELMDECDEVRLRVFDTYVAGLQMYRTQSDPYFDWSSSSSEEQEVPKALIRAAMGLSRTYSKPNVWVDGKPRHLLSEELTNMVMRRPKDVHLVVAILNDRELPVETPNDIAALEGLLDQNTENALLNGLL